MNHSTNKKRGNLFQANQSLVSSASQKTQKTSNTQIAASSKQNSKAKITPNNLKEETKDKMNATLNSKSSIASQQQFNKYEQKIMNIDLSQISNTTGNSNGKRANLFNEKSTSRERIYTRKTVQGHYDQAQNQNEIDLYNTPSFNIRVDKNNTPSFNIRVDKNALRSNQNQQNEMLNLNNFIEESKNQQQQQKQILQDFPFLQAQKTLNLPYQNLSQPQIVKGSGGMNDDENSEEEKEIRDLQSVTSQNLLSQDYFNPFSKKSQPNFMSMNNNTPQANSVMQTRNQNNHGLGANFFDGLETVSQSQVSYSPRFNANNNRREESASFQPEVINQNNVADS
ncbi:UNKNOWN [Stylonychia lemnae]|uniref:Uncharacterized protein n=1 Tax=Stylonychia lemnae TaxID=5949 RepID=A0A078ARU2_STYLE|nr:UNKNOWN [Stylonychia lemnae]|eukprot:CDW85205.1 UNKNOWN [Stylonychia lemnae]